MRTNRNLCIVLSALVSIIGSSTAWAATDIRPLPNDGNTAAAWSVFPSMAELSPGRPQASVAFSNSGDQTLKLRIRAVSWEQVGGLDHYSESSDLILSPVTAEVSPGKSQTFSIALRVPLASREQAYRLVFEDVTERTDAEARAWVRTRIVEVYRLASEARVGVSDAEDHDFGSEGLGAGASNAEAGFQGWNLIGPDVQVFASTGRPKQHLRIGPCQGKAPSSACVRLDNPGDRSVEVGVLTIERGGWRSQITVNHRILAGAWRQWNLKVPAAATGPIRVSIDPPRGESGRGLSAFID